MTSANNIIDFAKTNGFEIENLYIDKFWSSIADDKWIYVGEEMLQWMGYETVRDRQAKRLYVDLLSAHFSQDGYKRLNASEFKESYGTTYGAIELPSDFNGHNRTRHLLVSPDCFKESLMMLRTERATQIRKYYITLEKVYKAYMRTLNETNEQKLQALQSQFDCIKDKIVSIQERKLDEYIYIATSRNYIKHSIFKVGRTCTPEKRISGYRTGRCNDDKFEYVYLMRCSDGRATEQAIFSHLDSFRYEVNRELIQAPFDFLRETLDRFSEFEESMVERYNRSLQEMHTKESSIDLKLEDLAIGNIDRYLAKKFNIDTYVPEVVIELNPRCLTNEQINERLRPHGLRMINDYTGKVDMKQTFACSSVLKHRFEVSLDHMFANIDRGCPYCRKFQILDQIPIYVYADRTYEFICKYDTWADMKAGEGADQCQILRNIIREERWLTAHDDKIYSILSPNDELKLSLEKKLTEAEAFIISVLEINYDQMKTHILGNNMRYIIAIDEKNDVAYCGVSATEIGAKLKQVGSNKPINRKTITKYIGAAKRYGGYKWIRSSQISYNGKQCVDVSSL